MGPAAQLHRDCLYLLVLRHQLSRLPRQVRTSVGTARDRPEHPRRSHRGADRDSGRGQRHRHPGIECPEPRARIHRPGDAARARDPGHHLAAQDPDGDRQHPLGSCAHVEQLSRTILVIATNAGLLGISRLSYSMAGVDLLPHRLAKLHRRFKTPYVSIIVFGVAAALLVLPGLIAGSKEIDLMSAVYSLAATFAFCSAHLSVMRLRFIEPALHRPYRMPWNVKFGRDSIPVLSLVGALFIGTVFTQLLFENISNTTFIFMGWLALGVLSYVLYMRYRHQPIWEPLEVPPPREREVERVPFESLPRSARYRMGRR